MTTYDDIEFACVDGQSLKLDLQLPDGIEQPPLLLWIHGGGWRGGSRKNQHLNFISEHGYAHASISYRLTDQAIFPQQLFDCQAALRFLRAHAQKYGFDAERIAVAGSSAGGQLAMLLAVSGHVEALRGRVGAHFEQSTAVKAVVNYFGPSDFIARLQTDPGCATDPQRGCFAYLGGVPGARIDMALARLASPARMLDKDAPPLISFHGEADSLVLPDQAQHISDVYKAQGSYAELHLLPDAVHGDQALFAGPCRDALLQFLKRFL